MKSKDAVWSTTKKLILKELKNKKQELEKAKKEQIERGDTIEEAQVKIQQLKEKQIELRRREELRKKKMLDE